MKELLKGRGGEILFVLVIAVAASFLLLANLGNRYLWQDEAQTALIAKTILHRGLPYGTDGKNFFSQEQGAEYATNYLWRWHTWLSFYLVAASYTVFGVNTFAARFPSALLGVGSVLLTYLLAKKLTESKRTAVLAAILLTSSVPFLLLSRQCRYYSPLICFSVLALYAYLNLLDRKRFAAVLFVISATFVFHTHYFFCATLVATVVTHAILCHRERLRAVLLSVAIVAILNLPWGIWLLGMRYGERYGNKVFAAKWTALHAFNYMQDIKAFLFPLMLLIVALVVAGLCWVGGRGFPEWMKRSWKNLLLLILFFVITLAALVLTIPCPFFRYLAPLIPVFCILTACIIDLACRLHLIVGIALIAVLAWFQPLPDYLYEVTHDYDGPIEGISKFLNAHADPTDTVAITYGDLPLKFYTPLRVRGGTTGEDLAGAENAEWIVIRRYTFDPESFRVEAYLKKNVVLTNYEWITIDYPDLRFENRESPDTHEFRTDVYGERVVIARRIR